VMSGEQTKRASRKILRADLVFLTSLAAARVSVADSYEATFERDVTLKMRDGVMLR
jgi:hypothetical protein